MFADLRRYVNQKRDEFYLDGPNEVDFIMRNSILQRREEFICVDYVEHDREGHRWTTPETRDRGEMIAFEFSVSPWVPRLVAAMNACGLGAGHRLHLVS